MTTEALHPERQLLGAAIAHKAVLDWDVDAADFADVRFEALWRLMAKMRHRGESVTPATVAANLGQIEQMERTGIDPIFISDLYANAPITPAEARQAARTVSEAAINRRLEAAAVRAVQMARDETIPAAEKVELVRAEVDAAYRATAQVSMLGDLIDEKLEAIENPTPAIPTPWPDLNYLIRGWRPGALYVIGARPGIGKTIVGLQAAIDLANRGPVAFTSMEMPRTEIVGRVIAQTAEVALGRLDGVSDDPATSLTQRDWQRIAATRPKWDTLPLAIDDRASVTLNEIRSHARSVSRRGKLTGIVVDYLQLMSTPPGERRPRHEIVAGYSRGLKTMAMELGVPVIALSQLNRASEGRPDRRPTMSDLRESGAVEQDSDVVILLHTEEDHPEAMQMIVAKNRHGVQGGLELIRQGHYARAVPSQWTPTRHLEAVKS